MKLKLIKEHKLNRVLQPVGFEFEAPDQLGKWLVEQGVAASDEVPIMPMRFAETVTPAPASTGFLRKINDAPPGQSALATAFETNLAAASSRPKGCCGPNWP